MDGKGIGAVVALGLAAALAWFGTSADLRELRTLPRVEGSDPALSDPALEGRLVLVTGALTASPLGEPPLVPPAPRLLLRRVDEVWAWFEASERERVEQVGGGRSSHAYVSYDRHWTSTPAPSAGFAEADEHPNPPAPPGAAHAYPDEARVGGWRFDSSLASLPEPAPITLADGSPIVRVGDWRSPPLVGARRVRWEAVPATGRATALGVARGDTLVAGDRPVFLVLGGPEALLRSLAAPDLARQRRFRVLAALLGVFALALSLAAARRPSNSR